MIGCDNDECHIEWVSRDLNKYNQSELTVQFHLACMGLSRIPEGDWTCPQCTERLKKNPKAKRAYKTKARK
jgi:hypothetical protein